MSFFLGLAKGMEAGLQRKWEREKFYAQIAERRRELSSARGRVDEEASKQGQRAGNYIRNALLSGEGDNAIPESAIPGLLAYYTPDSETAVYMAGQLAEAEAELGRELTGRELVETIQSIAEGGTSADWFEAGLESGTWGMPEVSNPFIRTAPGLGGESVVDYDFSDVKDLQTQLTTLEDEMLNSSLQSSTFDSIVAGMGDTEEANNLENILAQARAGEEWARDALKSTPIPGLDGLTISDAAVERVYNTTGIEEFKAILDVEYQDSINRIRAAQERLQQEDISERTGADTTRPNISVKDWEEYGTSDTPQMMGRQQTAVEEARVFSDKAKPFISRLGPQSEVLREGLTLNRLAATPYAAWNLVGGAASDIAGAGASALGFPETGADLERASDRAYNRATTAIMEGVGPATGPASQYDMNPADYQRKRGY